MIRDDQQKRTLCTLPPTGRNGCYSFAKGPLVFMPIWPNFIFLTVSVSLFLMFEKYNGIVFSARGYLHVLKLHFLF